VAGPFTLSAESQLAYQYSDDYMQSLVSTLTLGLPLFDEIAFDRQRMFTLSLGIGHSAELEEASPFTFAQSFGPLAGERQSTIFATSGISFQWWRSGGRIDFTPPLALDVLLQNSTRLPVLGYHTPESDFLLRLGLNVPSFIPHHVVRLGVKATDVLGGPFATYKDSFSVPRGFPGPLSRSVSGQVLASVDYVAAIALLDQPLIFSFAATGAAIGVHAEGIGLWDNARPVLSLDPSVYVGGDFTLHMAFNAVPFAFVIGVAARIDTSAPGSFDAGRDLGVYLSVAQESAAVGLEGAPSIPVRVSP
jgi:hypothetical protein